MALVTANQFQLTPDIIGNSSRGISLGDQFRRSQLIKKQQEFLQGANGEGISSPTALRDSSKLGLDFQTQVAQGLGIIDERTKQIDQKKLNEAADFSFNIQSLPLEQQNIEIQNRIESLEGEGRDTTQTKEMLNLSQDDREKALLTVQLAALPNEKRLRIMQGVQAGTSEREFNNLISGFNEDEKEFAKKVKARIVAPAGTSARERIAEDDDLTGKVAESEKAIALAKEEGKLISKLKLDPGIKEAVGFASLKVKEAEERNKANLGNKAALEVYDIGIRSLAESLGNTSTGSIVGLIPALTSNQQIANGAKAVMLPILKSMFRAAGEGVFTDKDQEVLEGMLPTRTDNPPSVKAKLEMIDAIVQAKLKQRAAEPDQIKDTGELNTGEGQKTRLSDEELLKKYGGL